MTGDTVLVIAFNDVICCIKRYFIIYLCIVMGPGLSLTFWKGPQNLSFLFSKI